MYPSIYLFVALAILLYLFLLGVSSKENYRGGLLSLEDPIAPGSLGAKSHPMKGSCGCSSGADGIERITSVPYLNEYENLDFYHENPFSYPVPFTSVTAQYALQRKISPNKIWKD